jgi:uncharacterized SAM-dependent methyltransferase
MHNVSPLHSLGIVNIDFANDFIALLDRTQVGHMGNWKYSNINFQPSSKNMPREFWQEFTHSKDYYISNSERDLIRERLLEIVAQFNLPIETFIEFGPGASDAVQSKSVPFIHALGTIKRYVPIDIEQDFLDQAENVVNHTGMKPEIFKINQDFYSPLPFDLQTGGYKLAAMFGCTISNIQEFPFLPFPEERLRGCLGSLRKVLNVGDTFILTVDSNQDEGSLLKAYSSQRDIYQNLFWRIKHEVCPEEDGFNPENFEFDPTWFPQSHALSHGIRVKKNCTFSVLDRVYTLHAGEVFYFHNCYKVPSHLIRNVSEQAGFKHLSVFSDRQGRICLHVLRAV